MKKLKKHILPIVLAVLLILCIRLFRHATNELEFSDIYDPREQLNFPNCENEVREFDAGKNVTNSWFDVQENDFCINYDVLQDSVNASTFKKDSISPKRWLTHAYYWGSIYCHIFKQNRKKLHEVYQNFQEINDSLNLNRKQLANTIVTWVQNLDYNYVNVDGICKDPTKRKIPCIQFQKFGLLSPMEFLDYQKGDCDSRTMLLYTILRHFKFDCLIANSDQYGHSILAVANIGSGDYLTHEHTRYYVWETTATGWPLGIFPPNYKIKHYWYVTLSKHMKFNE